MKKFLAAVALLAFALPASAQTAWQMDRFDASFDVGKDGVVAVQETVAADFLTPRHGIFRYVPTSGTDASGKTYAIDVRLDGVMMDGVPATVSQSKEQGNVVWRVGDAGRTLTGKHVYVISYEVRGAIGRFQDHDEFYWNVSGGGWDVPLPAVSAKVMLPEGAPADGIKTECYTGSYGSTEQDCAMVSGGDLYGFVTKAADEPLTIVVGWPKGLVGEESGLARLTGFLRRVLPLLIYLVPAMVAFAVMYAVWKLKGSDKPLGTLVVQYEPPSDLRPAEVNAVARQYAAPKDVSATIVDLAVRGYVSINEKDHSGVLGTRLGEWKDYSIKMEKPYVDDPAVRPFERTLLGSLAAYEDGGEILVSSLKQKFYVEVEKFRKAAMDGLDDGGYFVEDPDKARKTWLGIAGVIALGGIFAFQAAASLGVSVMLAAIVVGAFGVAMGRWSDKGLAAAQQIRGYKEFISKVDKYRAPWMEKTDYFEKTLPYAIAFGLGAKWMTVFSGLMTQPPSWYHGATVGVWSPITFADDLNGWSKSFAAAAVSRPQPKSSGSGFGGGFSGGGFGGGGGGSW